jgi:hypothetical protein
VKEPFKLDMMMLHHVIATGSPEQWGERAAAELARQLHAAGAPDLPFEEQARALLASHRALVEAGDELPSVEARSFAESYCDKQGERRTGRYEAAFAGFKAGLDASAPILARRTQERDRLQGALDRRVTRAAEAEAERDALRQRAERAEARVADLVDEVADLGLKITHARDRIAELESRAEPGADVVERMVAVVAAAVRGPDLLLSLDESRAVARAVLSAVAAMGEEVWPSEEDILRAWWGLRTGASLDGEMRDWQRLANTEGVRVATLFRSRLSPVIGALRAMVAELEAETTARKQPPLPVAAPSARMLRDWPNGIVCCDKCYGGPGRECDERGNCECHRVPS